MWNFNERLYCHVFLGTWLITLTLNHIFHVSWHALNQSFSLLLGDSMLLMVQKIQEAQLCFWPSIFLLITFQRFLMGFRSGDWPGHDGVLILWPFIQTLINLVEWRGTLCWWKKQSSESRNRRSHIINDNFVHGLMLPLQRPICLYSRLAEAAPDHHRSPTKAFQLFLTHSHLMVRWKSEEAYKPQCLNRCVRPKRKSKIRKNDFTAVS